MTQLQFYFPDWTLNLECSHIPIYTTQLANYLFLHILGYAHIPGVGINVRAQEWFADSRKKNMVTDGISFCTLLEGDTSTLSTFSTSTFHLSYHHFCVVCIGPNCIISDAWAGDFGHRVNFVRIMETEHLNNLMQHISDLSHKGNFKEVESLLAIYFAVPTNDTESEFQPVGFTKPLYFGIINMNDKDILAKFIPIPSFSMDSVGDKLQKSNSKPKQLPPNLTQSIKEKAQLPDGRLVSKVQEEHEAKKNPERYLNWMRREQKKDRLEKIRKRDSETSDILSVQTLTLDEILAKKQKEAEEKGEVIDLSGLTSDSEEDPTTT